MCSLKEVSSSQLPAIIQHNKTKICQSIVTESFGREIRVAKTWSCERRKVVVKCLRVVS